MARTLTTREASNFSGDAISSRAFARLARRGEIAGATKVDGQWRLPEAAVQEYLDDLSRTDTRAQRFVNWWKRTRRMPIVIMSVVIVGVALNSVDFVLNIHSLFDVLTPGWTLHTSKASENEILILVAEFRGAGGYDPTSKIHRYLDEAIGNSAANLSGQKSVRLHDVPNSPRTQQEAIELGERYRATIVIWGTYDDTAIEPSMEVLSSEPWNYNIPELRQTVNTDHQSYNLYLARGLVTEYQYLAFLVIAKIHLTLEEFDKAISLLTSATELEVGSSDEHLNLAEIYALRGQTLQVIGKLDEAEDDYKTALSLSTDNVGVFSNYAILKVAAGRICGSTGFGSRWARGVSNIVDTVGNEGSNALLLA